MNSKIRSYQEEVKLTDGQEVVLRLICVNDMNALQRFYNRLSDDTKFLRFQYCKVTLTDEEAREFCEIDGENTLALVAEIEYDGNMEIVGVGRYFRLPDMVSSEVAFVVQDEYQRKGIGTHLLRHLAKLAWEQHINSFVAEVLRVNFRMLSIFRKADPEMKEIDSDVNSCTVAFSVSETMCRTPDIESSNSRTL